VIVAKRFRARLLVISQDVFPEIAVQLGRLENPVLVRLLAALVGFYLRRADRVVAIGETMRLRLVAKGAPAARVRVIPNWTDTTLVHPEPRDNAWAGKRQLTDAFVVMHSGNVGHAQDLDTLVRAATLLRDLDDLRIVIVGQGARHKALSALAEQLETDAVTFIPFQPRDVLSQSLSSADVHVVGLAQGLAGFVVPSRLYGILAAGRPVLAAAEDESETAQLVRRVGCGVVVPPGRPFELAQAIRALYDSREELDEMGRRGREYVVAEADRTVALERYRALLEEIRGVDGR
jgi:colanic acid biosynthesis glycosyl transferase WcaI